MSSYKENLRKNVRERRLAAKLSQKELGELCKRTDRFISAIETTPRNVTLETLEVLAEALHCTIFDLLGPAKTQITDTKRASRPPESIELSRSAIEGLNAAIRILNRARRGLTNKD